MDAKTGMNAKNQVWFELRDIRRRRLDDAVWIPLRAGQTITEQGTFGYVGYQREFFGLGSLAISVEQCAAAERLGWTDLGLMYSHRGWVDDGRYISADAFEDRDAGLTGVALVLSQRGNQDEVPEWHLHQDLVIALDLKREGDNWLAMDEGYVPVARLHREREGRPVLLEMRAEQLKDYLCARGMALYVVSYRDREEIVRDAGHIAWATEPAREESGLDRWEGHVTAIHEGGDPFGSTAAVIHIGRTNVDAGVDVPTISVSDEVISETYTIEREGAKLFRVYGELWRKEWVYPGLQSPRVRRDDVPAVVSFIIDAAGTRATADALTGAGRWLWFRPEVIMALAHRRGGALQVGSRDMGRVRCSPDSGVVFGVNTLGLVNVYAKDIAMLPAWQQQVWAGYTLTPEGGVAAELFAAQAEGRAARTRAPEAQLPESIALLNDLAQQRWGFSLFREHEEYERLLRHAHRFRSVNQEGLFALAKDLARLTADSIDTAALQKLVQPQKGEQWGSLKTLEHALAINVGGEDARSLLGPLVGIYNLRHAEAHLPTSDLTAAYALAKVNPAGPFVTQGYELLQSCVATLEATAAIIKQV